MLYIFKLLLKGCRVEKVLSGKKKENNFAFSDTKLLFFKYQFVLSQRKDYFFSFVRSLLLSCQPTLNLYSFVVRKGMLFAPHSIGLRRKFVHILFVFPFYFKCMQNKHINCNRKCLLYSKTYSGFVLIALI